MAVVKSKSGRSVWDIATRGERKASVTTTIPKNMVNDFKTVGEWLYATHRIDRVTPYATAEYLIVNGIAATLKIIRGEG